MKKKKEEAPKTTRPCAAGNCAGSGEYKAPKSRWETGEYQYLCLEHIREFNRAWDYFDGWTSSQIEEFRDGIAHGHRPTWTMSSRVGLGNSLFTSEKLRDSFFRMLGEEPPASHHAPERKIKSKERMAFADLNLETDATSMMVKAQYKKLVKQYHPDVNKGDKQSEETFKRITLAYAVLTKFYESSHEE